jgi:hypothetical protein
MAGFGNVVVRTEGVSRRGRAEEKQKENGYMGI